MTTWLCFLLMFLFGSCGPQVGPKGKSVGEPIGQMPPTMAVSRKAIDIIGGYAHACAHLDDNRASCWGVNEDGQCNLKFGAESRWPPSRH